MTKFIEEALNLPPNKKDEQTDEQTGVTIPSKENKSLSLDKDIKIHDEDMDDISEKALESFQDIMEHAQSAEYKDAAGLFNAAANFLKIAGHSKSNKLESKLKMTDLLIKAEKIKIKQEVSNVINNETISSDDNVVVIEAKRSDILDAIIDIDEE